MGEVSVSSSTGADEPTICLYVFVFCICIFRVFDKDKEKVRMWLYGRGLGELRCRRGLTPLGPPRTQQHISGKLEQVWN